MKSMWSRAQGTSRSREKEGSQRSSTGPQRGARGRGTLEKEKPLILGMLQRGGDVVIHMLEMFNKRRFGPSFKPQFVPAHWFSPMNTTSTPVCLNGAMNTRPFAIAGESMRAMKTATVFMRCTSTRWKAFGRYCVLGYALIGAFLRKSYRCIWASFSSCRTCDDGVKGYWSPSSLLLWPSSLKRRLSH